MLRPFRWWLVGIVGVAVGLMGWAAVSRSQPPAKKPAARKAAEKPAAERSPMTRFLLGELAKPIKKDVTVDSNFPLRLTLDYLSDLMDVPPILIDHAAYDRILFEGIDDAVVVKGIKREVGTMRLGDLLQQALDQLPPLVPRSTFLVQEKGIVIVPWAKVHAEFWGHAEPAPQTEGKPAASKLPPGRPRQMLPLIHADFQARPLADALNELADRTPYSVVLDVRLVQETARAPVTAFLPNAPLDTAVRVLADQADLKVVRLDNVLFVTTADHAATLKAEADELNKNELVPLPSQMKPMANQQ
jgi:hypothetical protein